MSGCAATIPLMVCSPPLWSPIRPVWRVAVASSPINRSSPRPLRRTLDFRSSAAHTRTRRGRARRMGTTAIGPYQVIDVLGRGGMSVVYRARHVGSGREVALKTVDVPSPQLLEGIRREIRALNALEHPGVVRILDHGIFGGRPWYAMPLIEGEGLRQLARRLWLNYQLPQASQGTASVTEDLAGSEDFESTTRERLASQLDVSSTEDTLPPAAANQLETVIDLVRKACMALAYLHGEGFTNRDLKPDNILVAGDQPVIIDFGLTAFYPQSPPREELHYQSAMVGTLPYMSPEQIRGEFVDARGDLYSIGCLLYELVVGRVPFEGSPREVVRQHLRVTPHQPNTRVSGVSPALNRLVMRLLTKHPEGRPGYAEDVATELAAIAGLPHPPPGLPPCRAYLYRPRFVGRERIVKRLVRHREQALTGAGSFVLVGGKSGFGKTRLGMEITRALAPNFMSVVISESHSVALDGHPVGLAPLHVVRPLLRAVADRCQEGGPQVTEELLGPRQSLLSLYEPLLRHVPSDEPMVSVAALNPSATRRRLFVALKETIAAFSRLRPVMWIVDDAHWADELSAAFLASLDPEYLGDTPLFILGLYREESTSESIQTLRGSKGVQLIPIPGLEPGAIGHMIHDMLASTHPPSDLDDLLVERSNGSPFLASNYLAAAVSKGLIVRDSQGLWQHANQRPDGAIAPADDTAGHGLVLEALDRLTPIARDVALAVAILGRNAPLESVQEITELSPTELVMAHRELVRAQLIANDSPTSIRFQHDKFREASYAGASDARKRVLHQRAANVLTREMPNASATPDPARVAYHRYASGDVAGAVDLLKIAAERAAKTAAYADAARLCETAISYVLSDAQQANDGHLLFGLYESLGNAWRGGNRWEPARESYNQALFRSAGRSRTERARLYRKLGAVWGAQHEHGDAARHYDLALAELGNADEQGPAVLAEWIEVQVARLWGYYFCNDIKNMDQVIALLDPVIQHHGTTLQQARFVQCTVLRNFRRDRYLVSEETLRLAKHALALCQEGGHRSELPHIQLMVGIGLVLQRSLKLAKEQLEPLRLLAEQTGDTLLESRCLAYLSLGARMRHDLEETQISSEALAKTAGAAELVEYIAVACANESWLAFHAGDHESARRKAEKALDLWELREFPFKWMAAIPLLRVCLACGDMSGSIKCVEVLLAPSQQLLPGAATDALGLALSAHHTADAPRTRALIQRACEALTSGAYR